METKYCISAASVFLTILCSAPAFAAEAVEDTSERDAIVADFNKAVASKDYDATIAKGLVLYGREDCKTLKNPGRSSLPYMMTEARLRKAGKSDYASIVAASAKDREDLGLSAVRPYIYEHNVITRLNSTDGYNGFAAAYKEEGRKTPAVFTLVYNILRQKLSDPAGAFKYALECEAWKQVVSSLQGAAGKKFTADDSALLFKAINLVIDDPAQIIDLNFAKTTADNSLLNLYTTGKISKDQFVSSLKKLYQRTYMNLSVDREKWEPVIASIKSAIVNADKINDFGE